MKPQRNPQFTAVFPPHFVEPGTCEFINRPRVQGKFSCAFKASGNAYGVGDFSFLLHAPRAGVAHRAAILHLRNRRGVQARITELNINRILQD